MKEKTTEFLQKRYAEIENTLLSLNDTVAAEKRDMNDSEKKQWETLKSEHEAISRELQFRALRSQSEDIKRIVDGLSASATLIPESRERSEAGAKMRDAIKRRAGMEIEIRANVQATGTADASNSIPVFIQDFIEPLNKGLILNRLNLTMKTGLSANVKYPVMPTFEASFVNEKETVSDTIIKDGSLMPTPRRIAICVPMTDLENLQTDGAVYRWVVENLALAVTRSMNRWLLQATPIISGVHGAMSYDATKNAIQKIEFAGNVPTYAELIRMRGMVQKTGAYDDGSYAYTMSGAMAAELEATRRFDSGDTPILVDNKIAGAPVLLSEYIEATGIDSKGETIFNETPQHVGFGRWSDVIVGQFGTMKLTIDPYTESKAGVVNIVLDSYWSVDLIRKASFVIGTVKQAQ